MFIQENAFENVVCIILAILYMSQSVDNVFFDTDFFFSLLQMSLLCGIRISLLIFIN